MSTAYDLFAPWYAAWTASAPVTAESLEFYVELYLATEGHVVELGVGDGRIAVEAARRGRAVTGVDSSGRMLELCRRRAAAAGVEDRVALVRGDFRDFSLPRPAALVALPFSSVGHLLSEEDRRAAAVRVRGELAPGGRFVLDHFVLDPELVRELDRRPVLRTVFDHPETGRRTLLWATTIYDLAARRMKILPATEQLDGEGRVVVREVAELDLAWFPPEELRATLEGAGFVVEALYGDFRRTAFGPGAAHQVWVARRA